MKILVTGFAPFGGQSVNPSWEAVKGITSAAAVKVCLPVEWVEGPKTLIAAMEEIRPNAVILFGQAGGRKGISLEKTAVNICSCKAPDNAGILRSGEAIREGAPDALCSTLPLDEIMESLTAAGIEAHFSYDAGMFICNEVMWCALEYARTLRPGMPAGFIHLPFMPGQSETAPCMPLPEQERAANIIADTVLRALYKGQDR